MNLLEYFIPSYPDRSDADFSYKIARRKEFQELKLENTEPIPKEKGIPLLSQTLQQRFFSKNTPYESALLFHGLGTGKCILPKTRVLLKKNNLEIEEEIETLYDIYSSDLLNRDVNGYWSMPTNEITVISFQINEKYIVTKTESVIDFFYKQYIDEYIISIVISSDDKKKIKTVEITQNHHLFDGRKWTNSFSMGNSLYFYEEGKHNLYKIIDIKKRRYEGFVYDLEIRDTHSYVANGFVSHNTCTSVLIVENFKNMLVNKRKRNPALIMVPNEVLIKSYMNEIVKVCTKNEYDISPKEKDFAKIKAALSQSYKFVTHREFLSKIPSDAAIKVKYSNRVIIVDEAHNLRIQPTKKKEISKIGVSEEIYHAMHRFLHAVENCRIILLSGTPIWDKTREIASLMNLILPLNEQLPVGRKFMKSFFDKTGKLIPSNVKILKDRFRGRVSYLREITSNVKKIEMGIVYKRKSTNKKTSKENVFPWTRFIKLYPCGMSIFQHKYANEALTKEDVVRIEKKVKEEIIYVERKIIGGTVKLLARDAATFVFPVFNGSTLTDKGEYGYDAFKNNIIAKDGDSRYAYKNPFVAKEITANLVRYSSIFAALIYWIKKHPTELIFIYNEFVTLGGGGAINLGLILKEHGFVWAKTVADIRNPSNKKRFVIITSNLATTHKTSDIIKLINSFNKEDNKYAQRCQIIIGSKKIAEGLTIKNIRQAHIVTPQWNIPSIDQALGRIYRVGSHNALPENERYVRIFRHASVGVEGIKDNSTTNLMFPGNIIPSFEETMDIKLYKVAEKKEYLNTQIYRLLKEASWDCPLTYKRNVLENDSDYTKECDYDKCNYRCDGYPIDFIDKKGKVWNYFIPEKKIIHYTYNMFYSEDQLKNIISKIRGLFTRYFNLNIVDISRKLSVKTKDQFVLLLFALNEIITKKVKIRNKYGIDCYLYEDNDIYFLNNEISSSVSYLDNAYISNPIIYKRDKLKSIIYQDQIKNDAGLIERIYETGNIELIKKLYYRSIIILLENSWRYKEEGKYKDINNNIIDLLSHFLFEIDGFTLHNMNNTHYIGKGYSVSIPNKHITGINTRIFDKKWRNVTINEIDRFSKKKVSKETKEKEDIWDKIPYPAYGIIEDNKFKIKVKPAPGKRKPKGAVCIEAAWSINRIINLFFLLGVLPDFVHQDYEEINDKAELTSAILSNKKIKSYWKDIENRDILELKKIASLIKYDKKQLCNILRAWFEKYNLLFEQ